MYKHCLAVIDGNGPAKGLNRVRRTLLRLGSRVVLGETARTDPPDIVIVIDPARCQERVSSIRNRSDDDYIPVVAYLEHCGNKLRNDLYRSGAHDVILHNSTSDELMHRLRNALESRVSFRRMMLKHEILQQQAAAHVQMLEGIHLEITRRLGRAAEYRDDNTGFHILRVSKTSEITARALGLKADNVELIAHASPLHDIGKIGIPDSILLKPGRLSEMEWRIMKRHTIIGARILSGSDEPLMRTAAAIALTHHERWDGHGYPRRLRGDRIPLAGRIVAVCDVFDALTSARPYKRPWSQDEAFSYIMGNAGTQFDPMVVSAFMEAYGDVREIVHLFADPTASALAVTTPIFSPTIGPARSPSCPPAGSQPCRIRHGA